MARSKNKKCVFDFGKLQGRIKELHITQDSVAKYLNINKSTFSLKINNQVPFSQDEVNQMITLLKIPDDEIKVYFFKERV
jgi:hypothetical protein|nr:MAG TPA: Protein of unknown function (DUF739) [Caudoviricetes sp.]